eukprot:7376783-Prymnesium_polylepis.1
MQCATPHTVQLARTSGASCCSTRARASPRERPSANVMYVRNPERNGGATSAWSKTTLAIVTPLRCATGANSRSTNGWSARRYIEREPPLHGKRAVLRATARAAARSYRRAQRARGCTRRSWSAGLSSSRPTQRAPAARAARATGGSRRTPP